MTDCQPKPEFKKRATAVMTVVIDEAFDRGRSDSNRTIHHFALALEDEHAAARGAVEELVRAAERALNWLPSYPGEAAMSPTGPYEQLRFALAPFRQSSQAQGDGK